MTHRSERLLFTTQLLLAAATGVAVGVASDVPEGVLAFVIVAAFSLVLNLARDRSETAAVLSGVGDERVRSLSLTAAAWTAYAMATVLIAWWLVGLAIGHNNETINLVCAVFGVTWLGCALLVRLRG